MTRLWIVPLDRVEPSIEVAGGKGVNLGRLAAYGFPVPPGFVVGTDAYRAFVADNDLEDAIRQAVDGIVPGDPAGLEAASKAIRERFAAGRLRAELAASLSEAYAALNRPAVAVRSSATAEDLPEQSFAGQHDTVLNVVGEEALHKAVVTCWSSLWTARAIGYRARQGIAHDDLALAVVIQEMAPSEASGVLFTADPLDGRRTEMVIETTLGLGEALVSGQVEPDRYRVEAASGRILEKTVGAKAVSIRPVEGGGTARQMEEALEQQALPDGTIDLLVRLGRQVAELFGEPQDVEWAWDGERFYLLQSRPITSLYPVPASLSSEPVQVLFSFGAVQGMLGPMTPLAQDAIRVLIASAGSLFGYHLTAESQKAVYAAGERLFLNITALMRNRLGRRVLCGAIDFLEPGVRQALHVLLDDPRLAATGGPKPSTVGRIARAALPLVGRLVRTVGWPEKERARLTQILERRLDEFEARLATTASLAARIELMEEVLEGAFPFLLPQFVPRFAVAMMSLKMLDGLAAGLPGGEAIPLEVTRGLPYNVTTEMDLALWRVARTIQADAVAAGYVRQRESRSLAADYMAGRLPRTAQEALAGFLNQYGMRGVAEIDLGRLRWREDPTPVMQAIQSYLEIEDPEQAPDAVFARGAAAAQEAVDQLAEAVGRGMGGQFRARRVRWAARRLRALAGVRESPKFWAVRVMGLVRAALLADGQALVDACVLAQPDDLFFLDLAELRALARGEGRDWMALVEERRRVYGRESRRRQVPRLLLSDGQAFYQGIERVGGEEDGILAGSPVSPGVVEGRVRVVLDPHAARLAPGEILVCPGTDPAWTPLFLVAGGLVMEVGGLMTHGSVVAREYGLPAVVGVSGATARLRTGQQVRVDGTAGWVVVLDGSEGEGA
jgi:phosphohistidine swiveling domain-containing protein